MVAQTLIEGEYLSMPVLRLFPAWEFRESGLEKFNGENWFADVQDAFPFPFNIIPTDISWFISTWTELAGAIALVVGLATAIYRGVVHRS